MKTYISKNGKFKVGDMVKVKRDENCCFIWASSMNKYAGNTYEIESICYSKNHKQNSIHLKKTETIIINYRFSESCLELVNESITRRAKVGEWVRVVKAEKTTSLKRRRKNEIAEW